MNTVNLKADAATANTTATNLISVKSYVKKGTEFEHGRINVKLTVEINESVLGAAGVTFGYAILKDTPEVRKYIKSKEFTGLVKNQLSKFAQMSKEEFGNDSRNPNYNEVREIISKIVDELADKYGFYR